MDPIIAGAGISAAGSLLGGVLGSSGASATNAAQIQASNALQQQANTFNAQQGDINRDYSSGQAADQRDFAWKGMTAGMDYNAQQADINRQFQAGQVSQQEQFQREMVNQAQNYSTQMANTAWQRGVADMKAAGINPILAANLGGASSPMGMTAMGASAGGDSASTSGATSGMGSAGGAAGSPSPMPSMTNPGEALSRGITSAAGVARTMADLRIAANQAEKDASQTDLNKSQSKYTDAQKAVADEVVDRTKQETVTSAAQQRFHDANAKAAEASAVRSLTGAALDSANTNTAHEEYRVKKREADDAERYGSGSYGQAAGASSRIFNSSIGWLKDTLGKIPTTGDFEIMPPNVTNPWSSR